MEKDDDNLTILILILSLLAVLLYLYYSGWFRRFWNRVYRVNQFGLNEPLLDGFRFTWTNKRELLLKRCEESSTKEIEDCVIAELECNSSYQIIEKQWNKDLDDGQEPVLVFCVISSRIGTGIENAMRGVHSSSLVILVLLHHVLSSLLQGDLSDDEDLLDSTLKNRMMGIVHFAFSEREGLYNCQQNATAFEKLNLLLTSLPNKRYNSS